MPCSKRSVSVARQKKSDLKKTQRNGYFFMTHTVAVPPRQAGPSPIASSVPTHPSAHRRLGFGTSPVARKARIVPPVEIISTRRPTGRDHFAPRSESPLARSTSYASLDRSFARIVRTYIIYDRACVRASIYIYIYMRMHLYPCEFAFVYMQKCKRSF